jgi:LPS-assembly lipoprotein
MWSSEETVPPTGVTVARRQVVACALAGLLTGCGFQLRGPPSLGFRSIALAGFAPRSPLAGELKRSLAKSVRVVDAPAQAEVVLRVLSDERSKSVVASTSAAQVREFQLHLKFEFRAETAGGKELLPNAELLLSRDLSYSETQALAKEQEEADLFREMQTDVVMQVMRRLASIQGA